MSYILVLKKEGNKLYYYQIKEDAQEEFGWKLVHGDVFRPPRNSLMLSVFVGAGSQVLLCAFITLGFIYFS